MPCIPHPHEIAWMHFSQAAADAMSWVGALPAARELLHDVVAGHPDPTLDDVVAARACLAEGVPPEHAAWEQVKAAYSGRERGAPPDIDPTVWEWARRIELLLCRVRTHLVRLHDTGTFDADQDGRFAYQLYAHKEHRHGDRIGMAIHYRRMGRPDLAARVEAMPLEQLLRDRACMNDLEQEPG